MERHEDAGLPAAKGARSPRDEDVLKSREIRVTEPPAERIARLVEPPASPEADTLGEGLDAGGRAARSHDPMVTLRLLRGREEGARRGKHQSGTAPFGYVRDYARRSRGTREDPGRKGVPLIVQPDEAEIVRLIFRLYLRFRSMKKVIEELQGRGLRTRRAKEWSRAGISWILKNDTYLGRVHFGAIRSRGEHEAIIAPIVYYKAQKLIRKNDKRGRRARAGAIVVPGSAGAAESGVE